jgi:hypothetical protein
MKKPSSQKRIVRSSALCTAVLTAALMLWGCGDADGGSPGVSAGELRWAPPELSEPRTIPLDEHYSYIRLAPTEDAVIKLPDAKKRGGVTIEGGNDIVLIGGEIAVPAGGEIESRYKTGLYIKGATGTVHVEGVRFGAARDAEWDAITINAPQATVQLENIRADRLRGRFDGFHADVVQPWGGVATLRINRLTASSNYQGLMIPIDRAPIGRAVLSSIDLRGLAEDADAGGHLLWLTSGAQSCTAYPVQLRNVYVEPRPGMSFGASLWPQRGRPPGCGAATRKGVATWPALPSVRGEVISGAPEGGPYVPVGVAGLDYASPGYLIKG